MRKIFNFGLRVYSLIALVFSAISARADEITLDGITYVTDLLSGTAEVVKCDEAITGDVVILSTIEGNGSRFKVTSIGERAFNNCYELRSIKLPDGLLSIGAFSFLNCITLESVKLPEGLLAIDKYAFYRCLSLWNINFPCTLNTLGDGAFYSCTDLASVNLSHTALKEIAPRTFSGCSRLAHVRFPVTLTDIGERAFYLTPLLQEVRCPASLRSIGNYAFCNRLFSLVGSDDFPNDETELEDPTPNERFEIILNEGLISIGHWAFCNRALRELNLPSTLESLGFKFLSGTKVTDLVLPESMKVLQRYCLSSSDGSLYEDNRLPLRRVKLPSNLEVIEEGALSSTMITEIELPPSLKSIGDYAFNNTELSTLIIPDGVTEIGSSIVGNYHECPLKIFEGTLGLKN